MQRKLATLGALLAISLVSLLSAAPAAAAPGPCPAPAASASLQWGCVDDFWCGPETQDPPQDLGTTGGQNSCTSAYGCRACGSMGAQPVCLMVFGRDGACSCAIVYQVGSNVSCQTTGSCRYRP